MINEILVTPKVDEYAFGSVLDLINKNINASVPWFLMASYMYYIENKSIMSDIEFDTMCRMMLENFDNIDHPHKYLISKDQLIAGTGFDIPLESYPQITIHTAWQYVKERGIS